MQIPSTCHSIRFSGSGNGISEEQWPKISATIGERRPSDGNEQSDCSACPQRENCDLRKLKAEQVLENASLVQPSLEQPSPDKSPVSTPRNPNQKRTTPKVVTPERAQQLIKHFGSTPLIEAYFKTAITGEQPEAKVDP
ncbi:MAG: hypothetical protein WAL75_20915 [Terracidiphilus sp.]